MRVVAGRFGGRSLVAPRGHATRPTSDRVREALFSILGEAVVGARVLDLFAGSGALAVESLSRGASEAVLVDSSAAAVAAIRRNLSAVGVDAEVRRQDALRALLREAPMLIEIDRTSKPYDDFQKWCREIVWWGNKKGAYLYSPRAAEITPELAGHY